MRALNRFSVLCAAAMLTTAAPLTAQAPAPPADSAETALAAGMQEGTTTAETIGTGIWTFGGFAGGAVLGPIGAGLAYALATSSASSLPQATVTRIGKKGADYQLGYQQAYTDKLTKKRKSSAFVGGVTGSALFTVGLAIGLGVI